MVLLISHTRNNTGYVPTDPIKRHFIVTILLYKSNNYYIFWVCVCSLRFSARKAHAPYYIVIYTLSGSAIRFCTLPHKWHDFLEGGGVEVTQHETSFDFLYNFCVKYFLISEELSEMWSNIYVVLNVTIVRFWWKLNLLDRLQCALKYTILLKCE